MEERRWLYDPHAPPREEPPGWVIAGAEPDTRAVPPPGPERPEGHDPGYGPPTRRSYASPGRLDREPRQRRRRDARSAPRRPGPAGDPPDGAVDEDEDPPASWPVVVAWTACYFLVPVLLYLGWALTRAESPAPGCVGADGEPCLSPRALAIASLINASLPVAGAMVLAVLVSLVLRRLTTVWRAGTVGFAAAVIGAGLATLVTSALG